MIELDERRESEGGGEEESYFVSMTDLMIGLLFVFLLMIMYFALQFRESTERYEQTTTELEEARRDLMDAQNVREDILTELAAALAERGIHVTIDGDALRLPDEILFETGSASLSAEGVDAIGKLRDALLAVLPCYAHHPTIERPRDCPETDHRIETIFIEGHTDDVPIPPGARFADNWALSAARAITVYGAMMDRDSSDPALDLEVFTSTPPGSPADGRPLFGVSGYADTRPVANNNTVSGRRSNRRIDLRIVMMTPRGDQSSHAPPGAGPTPQTRGEAGRE